MAIVVVCIGCNRQLNVPDKHRGRRVACPNCKAMLDIPAASSESLDADPQPPPARPGWMTKIPRPSKVETPNEELPVTPVVAPIRPIKEAAIVPTAPSPRTSLAPVPKSTVLSFPNDTAGSFYPPYVELPSIRDPKLAQVPDLIQFQTLRRGEQQLKAYRIRVLRPKFPWIYLLICLLFWPLLVTVPFVILYYVLRSRGHTFLYLTTQRLVIVELSQGTFGREQTVLNYSLASVSGFNLFAQRGIKRFLDFIKYKEKRTFYISIITNTQAGFALGSENTMNSLYDPGTDAVTLCSELDSLVLAIKAGRLQGAGQ